MKNRFYVYDRSKRQSDELTNYNPVSGQRWWIVDRQTGLPVADADTQYAARQEARMYNTGILTADS